MSSDYTPPSVGVGLDSVWVGLNTFLIFFMQLGFSFVECGTVRAKNVNSILMKNTLDVCVGTVSWWLIGYSLAFGESNGGFIGSTEGLYAGSKFSEYNSYIHWLNQWAFASTATTIISGAVAERLKITGYMILCFLMALFIYPIQVHWAWGSGGWLVERDYIDFAGVNAVHMVGGAAGLVGAILLGPRKGRFDPAREREFRPSSVPYIVLGTFLLWFCWYGFNCGTVVEIQKNSSLMGLVGMNTTLGAAGGALSCYFGRQIIKRKIDYNEGVVDLCMGILAGLVSITGCCSVVEPWAAFVIGVVAGVVFICCSIMLIRLKIDDPIEASTVHCFVGIWGGLATGIFAKDKGLIYGSDQIGIQALGILCIFVWTVGLTFLILYPLKRLGMLRCSEEIEERGFDHIYDYEKIEAEELLKFMGMLKKIQKGGDDNNLMTEMQKLVNNRDKQITNGHLNTEHIRADEENVYGVHQVPEPCFGGSQSDDVGNDQQIQHKQIKVHNFAK